jgi:hypothetical protein
MIRSGVPRILGDGQRSSLYAWRRNRLLLRSAIAITFALGAGTLATVSGAAEEWLIHVQAVMEQ